MEVVKKNFKESLPQISASIDKADFLVIDAEFTGIINGRDVLVFDTPEEYYLRLLNGSTQFLLIQFGLCAFYYDEEKKMYMNDAYNFYLFPRGQRGSEKIFMCQSSSLDFLAAQGFDFNKVIRDGISYMTEPIETKMRDNLTERQKSYTKEKDLVNIPDENKAFIEETCTKVRKFLDENKSDEMEIDRCNAFVRLLIYQELKLRFKDEIIVETKILENKSRLLKVMRVKSDSDSKSHTTKRIEREWEDFEDAVGFSKVARMISQSEKLVIGHNMLLDVIHTLNHFFQPLPDNYEAFKEFAHCMFPRLLDTKYMSSLPPFKDKVNSSVLPHLLQTLSEPPFALPKVGSHEGRGYSRAEDKLHEAGYDAYITGLCFLAMHSHLTRMRGEEAARPDPASAVLKPFLNKVFLAKTAHYDSPYMNFNGADPSPSRDHVFHLTFPKEWTRNDINVLFSPYGPVTTQFVDDTHAWVALVRREQARHVLRGLAASARVTVRPHHLHKSLKSRPDELEQLKRACTMTWTSHDHVIYIDNPVGAGFSFTSNSRGYCTNQTQIGEHLYTTLTQFFQLFPELQKYNFIISGESYAGKYIPALGYTIHKKNPTAKVKINLKGMMIGNGWSDPINQLDYSDYLYHLGFLDWNAKRTVESLQNETVELIKKAAWYEAALSCDKLYKYISIYLQNISFYNYKEILESTEEDDYSILIQAAANRKAIHVGNLTYGHSGLVYEALKEDIMQSVTSWISELLEHYHMLFYNGQVDIIVAYPLTVNFLRKLKFSGREHYLNAGRKAIMITYPSGEVTVQSYLTAGGNLTDAVIRNAGHMVPADQPEFMKELMTVWRANANI